MMASTVKTTFSRGWNYKVRVNLWLSLFIDIWVDSGFQLSVVGFWSKLKWRTKTVGNFTELIRNLLLFFAFYWIKTIHVLTVMFEPKRDEDKETEWKIAILSATALDVFTKDVIFPPQIFTPQRSIPGRTDERANVQYSNSNIENMLVKYGINRLRNGN